MSDWSDELKGLGMFLAAVIVALFIMSSCQIKVSEYKSKVITACIEENNDLIECNMLSVQ